MNKNKPKDYRFSFIYRNQIQFAPFSSLEMQKEAHIHVVSKNLYSQDAARTAAPFGVLDPKLVNIEKTKKRTNDANQFSIQGCLRRYPSV